MRICLVSSGLDGLHGRLQPWRYLLEGAWALVKGGHDVCLVSDGLGRPASCNSVNGLPVTRLAGLQEWPLLGNRNVARAVNAVQPDLVLWHVGLTRLGLMGTVRGIAAPVVGVFTSPVYLPEELGCLGVPRLLFGYRLSAIHVLGLLVPARAARRSVAPGGFGKLVVECETTRTRLAARSVPRERIRVIRPSIDRIWFEADRMSFRRAEARSELGFFQDDFVVGYFGPPALLRGSLTLMDAVAKARHSNRRIRLLLLSRQRDGEFQRELRTLERRACRLDVRSSMQLVVGFQTAERLVRSVAACDAIALPFQLVPSDVPASVLEALALGVPVITTDVACLPELVEGGAGLRVAPANVDALAQAMLGLAEDPNLRQGLAEEGRRRAAEWQRLSEDGMSWQTLVGQP